MIRWRDRRFGAEGVTLHVHSQNGIPALPTGFGDGLVHADGDVVHKNMERPETRRYSLDESSRLRELNVTAGGS